MSALVKEKRKSLKVDQILQTISLYQSLASWVHPYAGEGVRLNIRVSRQLADDDLIQKTKKDRSPILEAPGFATQNFMQNQPDRTKMNSSKRLK